MGVAERLCATELTMDSPGEFLSLSQNGPGACLTLLLTFLTETHNSLVRQARAVYQQQDRSLPPYLLSLYFFLPVHFNEAMLVETDYRILTNGLFRETISSDCAFSHSDYSVPLEGVSEAQLVLCHTEQELLPLLLTHCHYALRKGKETVSSYNLPEIENELARRFVTGKPLIQAVGARGPPLTLFVHGGGDGAWDLQVRRLFSCTSGSRLLGNES